MNFDLLLAWMSHVGSGSWTSFKQAVEELLPEEVDGADAFRAARVVLSDLGFADFFIDGTSNWRVLPPRLGALCRNDAFVLLGARSNGTVKAVQSAAVSREAAFQIREEQKRPSAVELTCGEDVAKLIAEAAGVNWSPNLAREILSSFAPLSLLLDQTAIEPPKNWTIRSFDLDGLRWVEQLLPNSACEYSSRFGERQFFVHLRKGKFIPAGKREGVFLAAAIRGIELVRFNGDGELSVPLAAPLPERLARGACCCGGRMGEIRADRICYADVPHGIANGILAALGQAVPIAATKEDGHG